MPAVVWLLMSGAFNALGELFSKLWANHPNWFYVVIIALAYAVSGIFWLPALLQQNKLSEMGMMWILIATISTVGLGVIVFKEQLSALQWVGISLAILSLWLLQK